MALTVTAADPVALANRLRPLLLHLNRHLRRETHRLGVSAGQISALATVRDNAGIGISDLATRESMSAPSISAHVDKLEQAGLLLRERDAHDDRRRVGLRITPEGLRVLRDVRSRRTAWLASRLEQLSQDERESLVSALTALEALSTR